MVEFDEEFASPADYARIYRDLGVQVVPAHLPSEGGHWKRPFGDWLEFQDALSPDAVFARWYDPMTGEHRRRLNMGFVCGAASGGLLCIDLDTNKPGSQAAAWWEGVLAVHLNGIEPDTWAQVTGGGGRQLFFRTPVGWAAPTFKAPGLCIDVRGQGGFAVTPPSRHASGNSYAWELGREPWACDLADAGEGLIEAVEHLREASGGGSDGPAEHTPSDAALNAVGLQVDDREHKLQLAVWGAVVDLFRESPIRPSEAEQKAERARIWMNYEATTKSRLSGPQWAHLANADLLEKEGRGYSELSRKWTYAMRRWDTKVAAAAAQPKPSAPVVWTQRDPVIEGNTVADADPTLSASDDPDPVDVAIFTGTPPERQWLVADWIVEGVVNSLYGPGGTGKSLLALQLAYAAITGGLWLGLPVKRGPVLAVFCEDDTDELHRRHDAIRLSEGHGIGNPYSGALVWPRAGAANVLISWRRDGPLLGIFHDRLRTVVEAHNPTLLILDTISDVFAGDERDRSQVNFFLKEVLGGLIRGQAQRGHKLTILLLGHPSDAGRAVGGKGYSGSTAWENAVRSRLYLVKPDTGGADERLLTRGKANYAASGEETGLKLIYEQGAFKCAGAHDLGAVTVAKRRVVELVEWAWKLGQPYMERRSHPRNLHGLLGVELKREGFDRPTVLEAIAGAIEDGGIRLSTDTSKRGWRTANG